MLRMTHRLDAASPAVMLVRYLRTKAKRAVLGGWWLSLRVNLLGLRKLSHQPPDVIAGATNGRGFMEAL